VPIGTSVTVPSDLVGALPYADPTGNEASARADRSARKLAERRLAQCSKRGATALRKEPGYV
jgi:hypothetical protein